MAGSRHILFIARRNRDTIIAETSLRVHRSFLITHLQKEWKWKQHPKSSFITTTLSLESIFHTNYHPLLKQQESQTLSLKRNIPVVNQQPNFPDKTEVHWMANENGENAFHFRNTDTARFTRPMAHTSSKFHNSLSKQMPSCSEDQHNHKVRIRGPE